MRTLSLLCWSAIIAAPLAALAAPAEPPSDMKAKFSVSQQTEVPGMTLQPGSYSIRVMDHLNDRLIVRIDGPSGGTHSTFIGLPNAELTKSGSGMVNFSEGPNGNAAARGFNFGGNAIEFVYPKADAVSLAKLNGSQVVAIDPASEGRVANKNLSKDDMEVVTLWTLSSTKVGPDNAEPAIKAERYQKVSSQGSQQVASVTRKPVIAKLPHTASYLPIIELLSALCLFAAGIVRFNRVS